MSDADIKRAVADIPVPTFEDPAFSRLGKPLSECTVAIVTTAGLHLPEDDAYQARDTSYRVLPGNRRDVRMGHWSQNFDRSGFIQDINVVYPVDRLHELAQQGVIGAVAPRHLAFTGNQDATMTALRMDSGPLAAELLKSDGVDVIVLTPV
jgi:D-proline reductase (dithiol) PrdB